MKVSNQPTIINNRSIAANDLAPVRKVESNQGTQCDAKKNQKLLGLVANPVPPPPPTMSTEVAAKVDAAIVRVASKLTSALVKDGKSSVFSAPGVTALMMFAANGTSEGEQREAFLAALGLSGMSVEEVNNAAAALTYKLANLGKGISVEIANLATTDTNKSGGFTDNFVRRTTTQGPETALIAEAPSSEADFAALTERINKWVETKTKGMIPSVLGSTDDMIWYLLSAISFKGVWTNPFVDAKDLLADTAFDSLVDSANGSEAAYAFRAKVTSYLGLQPWELNGKKPAEIRALLEASHKAEQNLMKLTVGDLRFVENDSYDAVMLPYGEQAEGAYMVAMLPKGKVTPKDLLARVGSAAFAAELKGAEKRPSDATDLVALPRFRTSFDPGSDAALAAFESIAPLDFGDLIKRGSTRPNTAVLKGDINVGPESTEAAQVAGIGGMESISYPPPPKAIRFNRPFAYAIVARGEATPIFQGVFEG